MSQVQGHPQAAPPKRRAQHKLPVTVVAEVLSPEQDLEEFKKYARKVGNSDRAGAMAFLKRAGIMHANGQIKKQFRD